MQVLASQLHFLANRNAGLAIPPLFWPVNCIKIGGHVVLLSCPTVDSLYCASTNKGKRRERKHIFKVLRDNGYPSKFIKSYDKKRKQRLSINTNADYSPSNFVVLPYIKGVTEKIYRAIKKENVKVCYKPTSTLSQQFTKPKDKLPSEQTNGVVYKICCDDCDFVYYGQTDRALITRIKEHKRSVSHSDQYSKIAKHAEQYDHRFDFDNATIVNRTKNVRERLVFRSVVFPQGSKRRK